MPQTIYNEGRVVGYSAYEVYVKQAEAIDPESEPATERQWLASSLAMGTSLLFQMPRSTGHDDEEVWMYEVSLPEKSRLCAANSIVATFFQGDAETLTDSSVWASKVTDYGQLIENDNSKHPSGDDVPNQTLTTFSDTDKKKLSSYINIVDGIFYQPGNWVTSSSYPPKCDFTPDLSKLPKLRLKIKGNISEPFWILFTGFTNRVVVMGESGLDSATDTPYPEDGDFLGPGQFPWASKITFSIPSAIANLMHNSIYAKTKNVTIDIDKNSFDVYISVDNEITSTNSFLVVTQTNDGGQTKLDLDHRGAVKDSLDAGTGILLNNLSSGKTQIQTNLEAGVGIKITDDSKSTKQTIDANFSAGPGISIETASDGSLVINNTAADANYIDVTGQGNYGTYGNGNWNDDSLDYIIHWFNHFYGHAADGSFEYSDNLDTSVRSKDRGTLEVQIAPSGYVTPSGTFVTSSAQVNISSDLTNSHPTYLTKANALFDWRLGSSVADQEFRFRHTNSYSADDMETSWICAIEFPPDGNYGYLSDPSSTLRSSNSDSHIWNVRAYISDSNTFVAGGYSWGVNCNVVRVVGNPDIYVGNTSGRVWYLISAISIVDGYNQQYNSDRYDGQNIYAGGLHLDIDLTITV